MADKGDLAPVTTRRWTRVDDYFEALVRLRRARQSRRPLPRTEPETPRFTLSTLPFLTLLAGLGVLAVAIAVTAWPGSQPRPRAQAVEHEKGFAPKGWFQEAQKEMRRRG